MNATFNEQLQGLGRLLDQRLHAITAGGGDGGHGGAEQRDELNASSHLARAFGLGAAKSDGHATGAATKQLQWFTPMAAERLLEYFAIDYVELGLPLPAWLDLL